MDNTTQNNIGANGAKGLSVLDIQLDRFFTRETLAAIAIKTATYYKTLTDEGIPSEGAFALTREMHSQLIAALFAMSLNG